MQVKNLRFLTTLADRLPVLLGQPQAIAVILSVVFHGLLFGAGPSFSSLQLEALRDDQPTAGVRPMPLLALTPEDQRHLPDFNNSDVLAPDQGKELKTLADPYNFSSGSLHSLGSSLNLNHLPGLPVPKSSFSSDPFGTSGRTIVLPLPSLFPNGGASVFDRPQTARTTGRRESNQAFRHQTSSGPGDLTMVPTQPTMAEISQGQVPTPPKTEDRFKALISRVQYSSEQTTEREVEAASQTWIEAVKTQLGQAPKSADQPLTVEVPYDLRLCLNPTPDTGMVGLALVPGEKAGTAKLALTTLKSTGYPFLNALAMDKIQAQVTNITPPLEVGTLYQVVVKVKYDSKTCLNRQPLLKTRSPQSSAPQPEK